MKPPLITVIVPVYNARNFVIEALRSIQQQNYEPLELIVINDGSTDDSLKIVRSLEMKMTLINQENAGPAAARNKGLGLAKGDFITFLDADDIWPENKLRRQLAYLLDHPQMVVVWGRSKYFGEFSERDKKIPLDENQTRIAYQLGSALFRREAFDKVGVFDETFITGEDNDWLLRATEMGLNQGAMNDVCLHHRMHPNSLMHSQPTKDYQIPMLVRRSLQRRSASGNLGPLPKLPGKEL